MQKYQHLNFEAIFYFTCNQNLQAKPIMLFIRLSYSYGYGQTSRHKYYVNGIIAKRDIFYIRNKFRHTYPFFRGT